MVISVGQCQITYDAMKNPPTCNGTPMRRIFAALGGAEGIYVYALEGVAAGTATIVWAPVKVSDSTAMTTAQMQVINEAWMDCNQTNAIPFADGISTQYQDSPKSMAVTVPAGGAASSVMAADSGIATAFVGGTGQTEILQIASSTGRVTTSYKAGGGTTTMSQSWTGGQRQALAHVVMGVAPVAVVDNTAPNLTSPTGAATGNTTASATVSTDEAGGTGYCLTQASATAAPNAAAMRSTGTAQAVAAIGVQTFAARTGLTADTLYKNYFMQDDAAPTPNTSSIVASPAFRTTGAVTFAGPVPTRNGSVGTAASFTNAGFFASAFTLAYTLQAGSLPAGLTLSSSTGIISGTPTATGTSSGIVIRATDTNGNTADTNAYAIAVASSNVAPTFPGSIINISGTVGSAITPVNVSGQFSDTDALAYSASPAGTAWPSGMSINASTGVITGTPTAAATTTGCKVRATDTGSLTADSNAFNFVLAAPALRTWASPTKLVNPGPTPRAGVAITAFINAMDGSALVTKTGLTTGSDGGIPSFTTTQGSLATNYRVTYSEDADPTNAVAVEVLQPT